MAEGIVIWALIAGDWVAPGRDPIPAPPFVSTTAYPSSVTYPSSTLYPGA